MKRYKRRVLYRQDRGMLAAQRAQPARRDPIVMLVEKGRLGHEHQVAAQQIAQCYEGICRALMPKVRDFQLFVPPPKGGRPAASGMPPALLNRYRDVYLPWTREMTARAGHATPRAERQNLVLVLDIVVDGRAPYTVARDHQMRWDGAVDTLRRGLELWGEMGR